MGEPMVGFGHKQAWLAVRDRGADQIEQAMGLRDLGPVSWRAGIDLAYLTEDRLVLTPILPGADDQGWTLVTGRWLLSPQSTVDLAGLSETLDTEVQRFASHRVLELHQWQRWRQGELLRSFGYLGESGEVTAWWGEPDATERAIGIPSELDEEASMLVGESDVMRMAAAWSVDPVALDGTPSAGQLRAAAIV